MKMDDEFRQKVLISLKEHEELMQQLFKLKANYQNFQPSEIDTQLKELIHHTSESVESLKNAFDKFKIHFAEYH